MEITIKPYSSEYAKQCAELEQYLWKEDNIGREIRFDWTYSNCPNYSKPLSVVAVNEDNEVIGFRGYFLNIYFLNNRKCVIAQLSDTVVSDKARRLGVFQKMTDFSLNYLSNNDVKFILNLSPSWKPYHGYKKIGFEDLAHFHSRYKFNLWYLCLYKILKKNRSNMDGKNEYSNEQKGIKYFITNKVADEILQQVSNLDKTSGIHSSMNFENLKWRTNRPNRKYIYVYAIDENGKLHSFIILKTKNYYTYDIGIMKYDNSKILRTSFNYFYKMYKPAVIVAWDFAIDKEDKKILNKLNMYSIPFINKIRKNPPALIRTLQYNEDGSMNWLINGIDIRKVENWSISKIDLDSF